MTSTLSPGPETRKQRSTKSSSREWPSSQKLLLLLVLTTQTAPLKDFLEILLWTTATTIHSSRTHTTYTAESETVCT